MSNYFQAREGAIAAIQRFHPGCLQLRECYPSNETDVFVGLIPIAFKGKTYNIPIEVTLNRYRYPTDQPRARVCPTAAMELVPSQEIDVATGEVRWGLYDWRGDFYEWLRGLRTLFEHRPPVKARTAAQTQMARPAEPQCPPPPYVGPSNSSISQGSSGVAQRSPTAVEPSATAEPVPMPAAVCCICMEHPAKFALVPCGHVALCGTCKPAIEANSRDKSCPLCRKPFTLIMEVYL
jgi:hypothetical protein